MNLRSLLRSGLCLVMLLGSAQALAEATRYPLTVKSCNREVTFTQAPVSYTHLTLPTNREV